MLLSLLAAAAVPAPAPVVPPQNISTLVVYGSDPCPRSKDDEIVVCARQPENERYRIPKALRDKRKKEAPAESWTARVRTMDVVSQRGLPNSCSPIGTNGQTGCFRQFQEFMRAQRQADKAEAAAENP
jgi:hypothetical protein